MSNIIKMELATKKVWQNIRMGAFPNAFDVQQKDFILSGSMVVNMDRKNQRKKEKIENELACDWCVSPITMTISI